MSAAQADVPEPDETIWFDSQSPASFTDLLERREMARTAVRGLLYLPLERGCKAPLVLISIGSRGFESGREALYIEHLTKAGFAVFITDSFAARGFTETMSDQSLLSAAGTCADALYGLRRLANHPKVDAARAAVLGYSRGGTVSTLLADARLQAAIPGDGPGFAAHVALYPSCSPQWRNPQPTQAPIIMLLGGADVMAPVGNALAYAAKLGAAGAPLEIHLYPKAHHSFDAAHPATPGNSVTLQRAVISIEDHGEMYEETTGLRDREGWGPFYKAIVAQRAKTGSMTGHGPYPRTIAMATTIAFLDRHLKP